MNEDDASSLHSVIDNENSSVEDSEEEQGTIDESSVQKDIDIIERMTNEIDSMRAALVFQFSATMSHYRSDVKKSESRERDDPSHAADTEIIHSVSQGILSEISRDHAMTSEDLYASRVQETNISVQAPLNSHPSDAARITSPMSDGEMDPNTSVVSAHKDNRTKDSIADSGRDSMSLTFRDFTKTSSVYSSYVESDRRELDAIQALLSE